MRRLISFGTIGPFFIMIVLSILVLGGLPGLAAFWGQAKAEKTTPRSQAPASNKTPALLAAQVQAIPAASFIQAADVISATDDANNWSFDLNGGFLTSDSGTDQVCLAAPVYLTPGSTLESFTVYVEDSFSSANLTVFLDRTNFFGSWDELASVTSAGGGGIIALTDSTILSADGANIASADYNYHVSFCLPAGSGGMLKVYGAQVNFTPPAPTTYAVYLPALMAFNMVVVPTNLLITNQTGSALDYTVFGTPQGDISCTIPNGATTQTCGTFTPGTYNFKAVAHCGQKLGQRTYKPGDDALTPFRCQ